MWHLEAAKAAAHKKDLVKIRLKHEEVLDKAMFRWGEDSEDARLRGIFHLWHVEAEEGRHEKDLARKRLEHEEVLNKAVFRWGEDDALVRVQAIFHIWHLEAAKNQQLSQKRDLEKI